MGERKRRINSAEALLRQAHEMLGARRLGEAKVLYEQVLGLAPSHQQAWFGLGMIARQTGAIVPAIKLLGRAVALGPDSLECRFNYAQALQEGGQMERAAYEFEVVCRSSPNDANAWECLGITQQSLGNIGGARDSYSRACALLPTAGPRTKLATLISPVMSSYQQLVAERLNVEHELEALIADPLLHIADPLQAGLWSNFYLAFHGKNNRTLQEKYAVLYARICPSLNYVAAHCRQLNPIPKRIRIGLISSFFFSHSIGRTSRGLFSMLPRDEFEVTAIFVAPIVDDEFSRFIRGHAEHHLAIPKNLDKARALIAELQLDILFYQDIGMEPFTYFLAFSRLAPVQCVSYGHPDTTGIATMDYFISNDLYETPSAVEHYTEKLFALHDLGTLSYYYRPTLPDPLKCRADFDFSKEDHLYICPQNLFKFHPDMDELISGILSRDSRGKLVVIAAQTPQWTNQMKDRWLATIPEVMDRIVFLPRQASQDYINLIAISDVMLDTVHFNGMNTSLEAFSVGTPVVTLPGEFQRGRHTQAMYRKMGLTQCIARNAEHYIELAVRLATDSAYRHSVHEEILGQNKLLFEDQGAIAEFARFFREAFACVASQRNS